MIICPQSDQQVDEIVLSIKADHPNDGEVLLRGHLVRMGIRITRQALRDSIHRVDHEGTVARQRSVIDHRTYSVPHPNYIWHIDNHHKLIQWREGNLCIPYTRNFSSYIQVKVNLTFNHSTV